MVALWREAVVLAMAAAAGWPGAGSVEAGQPDVRTLHVLIVNAAGTPPAVLDQAERAAQRIFGAAGIQSTWRTAVGVHEGTLSAAQADYLRSVIVVTLLSPPMETRAQVAANAMGFARAGGRHAGVLVSRVEQLASRWPVGLGVLLGHVMAHEIGHLLLWPQGHSEGGIMKAELDPQRVARGVLWFDRGQANALRTRVPALEDSHVTLADVGSARRHE